MTLYASRNLDLHFLDLPATNPVMIGGRWHWRVDPTFAAWAIRATSRAKAAGDLDASTAANLRFILNHVRNANPGQEKAITAAAKNSVTLAPIDPLWFSYSFLSHSGVSSNPPWSSFERDLAKFAPNADVNWSAPSQPVGQDSAFAPPDGAGRAAGGRSVAPRRKSGRPKHAHVPESAAGGLFS